MQNHHGKSIHDDFDGTSFYSIDAIRCIQLQFDKPLKYL